MIMVLTTVKLIIAVANKPGPQQGFKMASLPNSKTAEKVAVSAAQVNISVYKIIIRHAFQSQSYFRGLPGEISHIHKPMAPASESLLITFQI